MDNEEPLFSLPTKHIPELINILEEDFPDTAVSISWINNSLKWKKNNPNYKFDIFCPKDNWKCAVFIGFSSTLGNNDTIYSLIYAPENKNDILLKCMETSHLIKWEKLMFFTGVSNTNYKILATLLTNQGFYNEPSLYFYMSANDAANISIPIYDNGRISIKSLTVEENLEEVCKLWPYYVEDMKEVLIAVLTNNYTIGVFVNDVLSSMALQSYHGGIGMMQTHPNFKRKGLATIALATLTQTMGQKGHFIQLRVNESNVAAKATVEKVGFKIINLVQGIHNNRFYKH